MSETKPISMSGELEKNARHGANYELGGAVAGAAVGLALASKQNAKGMDLFFKATDVAFWGWMIGWVARLWTEGGANRNAAAKMDNKVARLEAENKFLKDAVVQMSEHVVEPTDNHADKLKSERSTPECGCQHKH